MRILNADALITLEIPNGVRSRALERLARSAASLVRTSEFSVPVRYDGEAIVGPATPGACRKCFNLRRAAAAATPDLGGGLSEVAGGGSAGDPPDAFADWVESAARRVLAHAPADLRRGAGRVMVVSRDGGVKRFVFRPRYDCVACRNLLRSCRTAVEPISETLASRGAGLLQDPATLTGWPLGAAVWTSLCRVSNHRFAPVEHDAGGGRGLARSEAKLDAVSQAVSRYAVAAAARRHQGGVLRGRDLYSGTPIELSATEALADGAGQPDAWATAARRSWTDAVDAALLEAAKRDAFMAVWFEGRTALPLGGFEDDVLKSLAAAIEADGSQLTVRVAPAVSGAALAVATISQQAAPKFALGLGCSRDFKAAVRDAVVEAVQARRHLDSRTGADDLFARMRTTGSEWFADYGLDAEATLRVFGARPTVSFDFLRNWLPRPVVPQPSYAEQMVADGFAPVVVDITPADVKAEGWAVARVGVPSLRRLRPAPDLAPGGLVHVEALLHPFA